MGWVNVRLGDILERKRDTVIIKSETEYKLVTIKLHHKGVVLRNLARGNTIKSKMTKVKAGDFVLSGIDARNGAFGIVPDELEDAIISNDFWCLVPNEKVIKKEFLLFITSTEYFDYICKQSSDGTTQRIRLQRDKFFDFKIIIPPISEQDQILKKLIKQKTLTEDLKAENLKQLDLLKKLYQQILQDAVQGKLVPQDLNDEPASKLLEKITSEKERLIKAKKIKRDKLQPGILTGEVPFEIPKNWVWCRLGNICTKIGSGSTPTGSNYSKEGIPFFRSQNIYDNGLVFDDITFISKDVHKQMNGTVVRALDILLNITGGSLGRCALVSDNFDEGNVSQHVCIIRPVLVNNEYLHKVVLSPYFQKFVFESTTGAGREGLPKYNLEQFAVPVPPIQEQSRIVKKIGQLMNFSHELEQTLVYNKKYTEDLLPLALKEALTPV